MRAGCRWAGAGAVLVADAAAEGFGRRLSRLRLVLGAGGVPPPCAPSSLRSNVVKRGLFRCFEFGLLVPKVGAIRHVAKFYAFKPTKRVVENPDFHVAIDAGEINVVALPLPKIVESFSRCGCRRFSPVFHVNCNCHVHVCCSFQGGMFSPIIGEKWRAVKLCWVFRRLVFAPARAGKRDETGSRKEGERRDRAISGLQSTRI